MAKVLSILFLAVLVGLQARLWMGPGSIQHIMHLKADLRAQDERVSGLRLRNQQLMAEVKDLKNSMDALEERARHDMGMIREGETFFQYVPSK